jgi:hypothetical protein
MKTARRFALQLLLFVAAIGGTLVAMGDRPIGRVLSKATIAGIVAVTLTVLLPKLFGREEHET